MKYKTRAILLAFFLGGIGVHQFYLRNYIKFIFYSVFFWTLIPAAVSLIDMFLLGKMTQEKFDDKYNNGQISSFELGFGNAGKLKRLMRYFDEYPHATERSIAFMKKTFPAVNQQNQRFYWKRELNCT